MQEILALTLQSMQTDAVRLERVSMNLVNALTPGYKREVVAVRPFMQVVDALVGQATNTAGVADKAALGVASQSLVVQTDTRPGMLKSTGQRLDLAIAGRGFFEVMTDNGPAYTRQGNFQVDPRGRLVTAQGNAVMGKGGEILLNNSSPVIDASGNVFENGRADSPPVAQLKVVQFEHPESLQKLGDGLLASAENPTAIKDADLQIRQGFLENSNVSSMHEMVQLIQTMRHFESMQKIALGYDEMMGTAIRKLGELS